MSRPSSNADAYRVALTRMNPKTVDEELLEICKLSGVKMDPEVFKILLELIKLNVSPTALVQVLRKVVSSKGYGDDSRGMSKSSSSSQSELGQSSQSDSSLSTRDTSALSNRLKELKAQMQAGH